MASIDSPKPPAAPMPASHQSKPLGVEMRMTCTAALVGGTGESTRRGIAAAAAGTIAPSASARPSVVLISWS